MKIPTTYVKQKKKCLGKRDALWIVDFFPPPRPPFIISDQKHKYFSIFLELHFRQLEWMPEPLPNHVNKIQYFFAMEF